MSNTAAFHAQQAVEKYLKAYLIYREKEISKTLLQQEKLPERPWLEDRIREMGLLQEW